MKFLIDTLKTFTKFELALWLGSLALIISSFFLTGNDDYLVLTASLVGATALILVSKGNVAGQVLTVAFAVFYGIISFRSRYYGEMITYLGMSAPIAVASVVTWLRHSCKGKDVKVNSLSPREYLGLFGAGLIVSFVFFFILRAFHTSRLLVSTVSVLTSFLASYLTMRRSAYYAVAYAANDVVLVALWILASLNEVRYLPMVICFLVFLANDLYGFFNWSRTGKRRSKESNASQRLSLIHI